MKRTMIASATALVAMAGGVATAAPADAAVVGANNLVNVQLTNILNHNQVALQVPINAAANICGVTVAVLSAGLANGPVRCAARGNQVPTVTLMQ